MQRKQAGSTLHADRWLPVATDGIVSARLRTGEAWCQHVALCRQGLASLVFSSSTWSYSGRRLFPLSPENVL